MGLTKSQAKTLKIVTELSKTYAYDPIAWVRDFIDFRGLHCDFLTDQQVEIAEAIISDKRVCVSAGGGVGKSAVAAMLCIWFESTHPYARIPTTAPSSNLLKDVLWAEISFWLRRCKLSPLFELKNGRLEIKGFGKDWYATARTVPKDSQYINDTMAGFHSGNLFFLVDEASGVPDAVYTAIEGAMTQPKSYILLISNPVSVGGYYFDTINDPQGKGAKYKVLFFDSRRSPLVSSEYEENIITRYGKDHPMYRAKVCGLPLETSDSIVVTPAEFDKVVSENKQHFTGDIAIGVDVGGESGGDLTVLCHKESDSIIRWEELPSVDEDYLYEHILMTVERLYRGKKVTVVPDCVGIGAGLYSRLRNSGRLNLIKFVGSEKDSRVALWESRYAGRSAKQRPQKPPTRFLNRRTEAYDNLKRVFHVLHFPVKTPERLKKELANLVFDFSKGPTQLEDKKSFKKRMQFSPDFADALMLACWADVTSDGVKETHVPAATQNILKNLMHRPSGSKFGKFQKFIT